MRRFLQSLIIVLPVCACILARAQSSQTVNNGQQTQAITFPAGCVYNWTNDKPGIGLAASGSGDISSFTAINTGTTAIVATIKVTPVLASYAYIANQGTNTVSVINAVSHTVIGTVGIGITPVGVVASPDGKRVYAANNVTNDVSVINTADNSLVKNIPVGLNPFAIAISPDSRWVYVSNQNDGNISVIDAQSNTVHAAISNVGSITSICVSPDGKWVYAATEASPHYVYVIDASTNTVSSSIPISTAQNVGMVITPDGKSLYLSNNQDNTANQNGIVSVINLATKSVSTIIVGSRPDLSFKSGPYGITINSTGTRVYVVCSYQNEIDVINTANNTVIKTIHVTGGEIFNVAISNDDKELYVINRNANEVEVFNTANYTKTTTITDASFNSPFSSGNFISKGPGCGASSFNFTITVNPSVPELIAPPAATGTISACVGSPSASPNIQQFTVSGAGLTNDITGTVSGGFEVSLLAGSGFGSSVILKQSGGKVTDVVVYVRSASSAATGPISGKVTLASARAPNITVAVSGTVNALPAVNAVGDRTYKNGDVTTAINFTGTGKVFSWSNDNTAIGLAATGTGNLPSFTAINNTTSPVKATITVTPQPSGYAYITNESEGTVSVINSTTKQLTKTITVGAGPTAVAVSPDNRYVYIVNNISGSLSVIDVADNHVKATVDIGVASGPTFAVVSPDGKYIYVANERYGITVIDAVTNTVKTSIGTGSHPLEAAITPDGKTLYVTAEPDALFIVETATNKVNSIIMDSPRGLLMSPDGKILYVSNLYGHSVSAINTSTNSVIKVIPVIENPLDMAISSDGTLLYVINSIDNGVLSAINTITNAVTNVAVGRTPTGVSITADDKYIYVTNYRSNDVSVIDAVTNTLISTITAGGGPSSLGNFITNGTGCTGIPTTFTITVNAQPPAITTGTVSGAITACAGSPSASPNILQFPVSGSNLTNNITATVTTGFEISLSANSGFGSSVTLNQSGGTVTGVILYVRSAASATGPISGNVTLASAGAANVTVGVNGFVNVLPAVNAISDKTYTNGHATDVINFTGTGNAFTWTNDNPTIGLPAGGDGDIPSFTAVNTGNAPAKATIRVVPNNAGLAFIANSQANSVSVINTLTNKVTGLKQVGSAPVAVAVKADGSKAYIANRESNNVSVIDMADNTVSTINVGQNPTGIALSPDGARVYVTNSGSSDVSVINTSIRQVITNIAVGDHPYGVAISPDGTRLYVANGFSASVSVINTQTNAELTRVPVGQNPIGVSVSADGSRVYVANISEATISVINAAANTVSKTITLDGEPSAIAVTRDGGRLYVTTNKSAVYVVDAQNNTIIKKIAAGLESGGLSISPDGNYVYVNDFYANTVEVISTVSNTAIASIPVGAGPAGIGDFISAGTGCTGVPVTFTITVNQSLPATISTDEPLVGVNTTYGTPSAPTTFTISGANMQEGIKITPPAGVEVSSDGINFSTTITVGAAGIIPPTTIYVRLAKTSPVGPYSGPVNLSSAGAVTVSPQLPASAVSPAPLTVTANNKNKDYGTLLTGTSGSADFTITGLQNSETAETVTVAYDSAAAANAPAGSYPGSVTPSALAGGTFDQKNYSPVYVNGDITVNKVPLTITADNKRKIFKDPNPILTVTYDGFVNNEGLAQLTTPPVISTTADQASPPGEYPIIVSGATALNYNIALVNGILTVIGINVPLTIPNTFTPNADGINDTWNILNIDEYPGCTVNIYNRWGQSVFSSIGYGKSWDGKYRGVVLPVSTYYYIIDLKNGSKPYSGNITIVR